MVKLHKYQSEILKKLNLSPMLTFNKLVIKGLVSEHMNYHLKRLISDKYVEKVGTHYSLTNKGKDFVNLLDDDLLEEEKLPKVSVLINCKRKRENGEYEYLYYKRLRQPFYGKVGMLGGKIHFSETPIDAAKRELCEETGLIATKCKVRGIYHKMRTTPEKEVIMNVIFFEVEVLAFKGTFISKTEFQENFWLTKNELSSRKDLFDDVISKETVKTQRLQYVLSQGNAEGY